MPPIATNVAFFFYHNKIDDSIRLNILSTTKHKQTTFVYVSGNKCNQALSLNPRQ